MVLKPKALGLWDLEPWIFLWIAASVADTGAAKPIGTKHFYLMAIIYFSLMAYQLSLIHQEHSIKETSFSTLNFFLLTEFLYFQDI